MTRLVISTLPKSGTHLVKEVVKRLGLRRGVPSGASVEQILAMPRDAFALGHRAYSPTLADRLDGAGIRMLGMVRDPRDFVVSLAHHQMRTNRDAGDFAAVVADICHGDRSIFDSFLAAQRGWQTDPRVVIVRFEELIGPRGGGSEAAQLDAGRRIAAHLDLRLSDQEIVEAVTDSYRTDVAQFRRGQIGAWRDELPPEIAAFINEERAQTLRDWGY